MQHLRMRGRLGRHSLWEGSSSISDCLDACTAKTVCFGVGFKTPANEAKQVVWCIQYSFVEFCSYAVSEHHAFVQTM